jgi:hypothetical protein
VRKWEVRMNLHFVFKNPSTLEEARCQVATAEALVTEQQKRVAGMRARGWRADKAELLLKAMLNTLRLSRERLELLERLDRTAGTHSITGQTGIRRPPKTQACRCPATGGLERPLDIASFRGRRECASNSAMTPSYTTSGEYVMPS